MQIKWTRTQFYHFVLSYFTILTAKNGEAFKMRSNDGRTKDVALEQGQMRLTSLKNLLLYQTYGRPGTWNMGHPSHFVIIQPIGIHLWILRVCMRISPWLRNDSVAIGSNEVDVRALNTNARHFFDVHRRESRNFYLWRYDVNESVLFIFCFLFTSCKFHSIKFDFDWRHKVIALRVNATCSTLINFHTHNFQRR